MGDQDGGPGIAQDAAEALDGVRGVQGDGGRAEAPDGEQGGDALPGPAEEQSDGGLGPAPAAASAVAYRAVRAVSAA